VPNLWENTTEAASAPDLNPLTNPVLERNLGRWAKVYFSTPPANREQAVISLLEELKRESGSGPDAGPARQYFARQPKFQSAVCAICQRQNPPGHKFCSRCGEPLDAASRIATQTRSTESGARESAATERVGVRTERVGVRESAATRNPGVPPGFGAQFPRYPEDAQWVQERAFGGMEGFDAPPRRGWKYLVGAAAIVLAGFAYVQWSGVELLPVTSSTPPSSAEVSAPAQQPNPSSAEVRTPAQQPNPSSADVRTSPKAMAPASTVSQGSGAPNAPVGTDARDRTAPREAASHKASLPSLALSRQPVAEGGGDELRLAQRYLGGSMGVRDSSEAAKLLWKAVSKQNATAAVLLSGLYLRGDGVPRSCDQARLLLVAAVKRGAPEAAQPLRNLELQGCR
jgi:hypothetical protein